MIAQSENLLSADLNDVLEHTSACFQELRQKRIFITGGTGFFGRWLLETFIWANRKLQLNASALVLTRDCQRIQKQAPTLFASPELKFWQGDVRNFVFPEGRFDYIIHAATENRATLYENDPAGAFAVMVQGMQRVLEFSHSAHCQSLLFTSSGAVYGPQPDALSHIPEDYRGAGDPLSISSVYGEGKRSAELLAAIYAKQYGVNVKVARCFAFVGPYLPLDAHFAIGNFIRDGLKGGPLKIRGDGTPHRSYLYASDLMTWLWTLLVKGQSCRAYNVGSEDSYSIQEIAQLVSDQFSPPPAIHIGQVADPTASPARYVPSTKLIQKELGLLQRVDLPTAIAKTIEWHRLVALST